MTHIYFMTSSEISLSRNTCDTNTVPRVGEEIALKTLNGFKVFKVASVTWYEATEPYEGLEAEVELSLSCKGQIGG